MSLPSTSRSRSRRRSAGILLFRRDGGGQPEVLLVHPGGPIWSGREEGAWSIPKGEPEPEEDGLAAARREFLEELGTAAPDGQAVDLGEVRQRAGKLVHAWAVAGDLDPGEISSNTFAMEWPPRSGRMQEFPEVDRAEWFPLPEARSRINPGQAELLDRLQEVLSS